MHKHIILFFSALLLLLACKNADRGKGIIDEDEMINLLTDIHIVDGSLALQPAADSMYKYGTGRYLYLFKQYHIDSARFKKSMKYYTAHPDVLIEMYDEVNANLQVKYDSLNKIIADEAAKRAAEIKKFNEQQAAKQKIDSAKAGSQKK